MFIIFSSTLEIGKTNPFNRMITKTFNQFTSQIFTANEITKFHKSKDKKSEIIKNNLVIFSKDHNGHYILSLKLFKESPLFGVGPKGFRHYCRTVKYDPEIGICSTHPHNILAQIISETGIIGFLIYLFSVFYIIFKLIYNNKKHYIFNKNPCFVISSISVLLLLFPLLPSGNFFNNWNSIVYYFYIGIYLYSYHKVEILNIKN